MVDPSASPHTDPVHPPSGINRFAARGHHRLAYEFVPAVSPDAPVVLLLHGLLAGRAEWARQRAALAGRFTLILAEARGHGVSAALTDRRYALADLVADTLAVLDHAGIEHAHVVGHGLGGATAWELALTAPERVRSLTLIEPELPAILDAALDPVAGSLRRESQRADLAARDAADKGLTDNALDAYLSPRRGADWRVRVARPEQAAFRRHAPALAGMLTALHAHEAADATTPTAPTFVVHGAATRSLTSATASRLAALVSGARLRTTPTASPFDNPLAGNAGAVLGELLRTFLTEQSTPSQGHEERGPPTPARG